MNKTQFQQKISEADKPVVVDFWASWCAPCMVTKPVLEKLAKEYVDKIQFMPVNADDAREVLEQFHVTGIPTVITFRNGQEIGRVVGAQGEKSYRAMFESIAAGKALLIPLTPASRMFRLSTGGFFFVVGISYNNWFLAVIGALIAFMGFYDRCPLWNIVTGIFKRK